MDYKKLSQLKKNMELLDWAGEKRILSFIEVSEEKGRLKEEFKKAIKKKKETPA